MLRRILVNRASTVFHFCECQQKLTECSDTLWLTRWSIKFMISSTLGPLAQLERGFTFPLIEFIVNIFEYSVFFLCYGTLADFVKTIACCFDKNCCLVTLPVTVKFVILSTLAWYRLLAVCFSLEIFQQGLWGETI